MWKRHLGSSVALLVGGLSVVAGLSKPGSALIAGVVILLGALAYRSAKKRTLGEVNSTVLRKTVEWMAVLLIVAIVLFQKNLAYLIATDPVPNAVIPLWAIIAYLVINLMPRREVTAAE